MISTMERSVIGKESGTEGKERTSLENGIFSQGRWLWYLVLKKKKKCQSSLGLAYTVLMARFSAGVAAEIEQDFLTL